MATSENSERFPRLSRRGALRAFGLGAAGAVAGPSLLADQVAAAAQGGHAAVPNHFGRLFPTLPPFAKPSPSLHAALLELGRPGGLLDAADDLSAGPVRLITDPALSRNNPNNPTHTAGTTFLGQFIDHDMTFDASSRLGVRTESGRDAQLPVTRARPRLGVRRRPRGAASSCTTPPTGSKLQDRDAAACSKTSRGRADGTAIIARPAQRRARHHRRPARRLHPLPQRVRRPRPRVRHGRPPSVVFAQRPPARRPGTTSGSSCTSSCRRSVGERASVAAICASGRAVPTAPRSGADPGRVPGGRLPVRALDGPALLPRQPRRRLRPAVLRLHLRPLAGRRRRPGRPARGPARPAPLRRLADVLRLRRRPGEAEQADRHAGSRRRSSTCRSVRSRATTSRPPCPSGRCSAT